VRRRCCAFCTTLVLLQTAALVVFELQHIPDLEVLLPQVLKSTLPQAALQ
jgi:hypothetical protein